MTLAVAYAVTVSSVWPRSARADETTPSVETHGRSAHGHAGHPSRTSACRRVTQWKHADQGAGMALVQAAQHFLGCPYRYGGASVDGFDCSGLVWYVHQMLRMPVPRTADEQGLYAQRVSEDQLQPGDLVFFHFAEGDPQGSHVDFSPYYINHVGIYTGDGHFIHAPKNGKLVSTSRLSDFKQYFVKAGRYWTGAGMLARE